MHRISTYILLFAVIAAQLFGGSAMRTACADAGCQCSVQSKSSGNCCCSGKKSNDAKSCCTSKKTSNSCDSNSGSLQRQAHGARTVCHCGCEDSSQPIPAQPDAPSDELTRLLCQSSTVVHFSTLPETRAFESAAQSSTFYGGLSAQPLYCSWLI